MPEQINPQLSLQDHFKNLKSAIREQINALNSPPDDRLSFIENLKNKYKTRPIQLQPPTPSTSTIKNVPRRLLENTWVEKVFEIKVTIPYKGDKELFNCKPVPYDRVFTRHRHILYKDIIVVYVEIAEETAQKYEQELNAFVTEISKNLERINNQAELFNDDLYDFIDGLLRNKETELNKQIAFRRQIGLNINPRSNEFLTPSPVKRKAVPLPSAERINGITIPVLESKVYNDIREVLYHAGQAMERKPSLYLGKHEEDLRDIFLLFLETRYESTTGSGEAFNKKGKTDILLKYAGDGTNVFVAECKIWKGQKKLFEAIDQLLGYLTWRDTKTALMIFVKQPDFSKAIEVVSLFVNRHPNFKRFVGATHPTSFAYEMSLTGDSSSSIWIEFMLFHFPG
ncbi:hypothetical protein [Mucilaginibacter sp. OK098]|uniref:hypothetical protein n=1 Tax=Mucilaginibacter sp. OK098 TaxID=1855297 RepID=UPI000933C2BC|nr:hypothetical protein [Mucilaginibacter sp. OK098]